MCVLCVCLQFILYTLHCSVQKTLYSIHCSSQLRNTYIPPCDHCNLIGLHILHGEVEPYSKTGIASVRPYEQIILDVRYIIHSAEIS